MQLSVAPVSTRAGSRVSGKFGHPDPAVRYFESNPICTSSVGPCSISLCRPGPILVDGTYTGLYRREAGNFIGEAPTCLMRYGPRPNRPTASSAAAWKSSYVPTSCSLCTTTHSPKWSTSNTSRISSYAAISLLSSVMISPPVREPPCRLRSRYKCGYPRPSSEDTRRAGRS